MRCEDSVGLRAVFMRLSLSGSLEILEASETASRVDAGRERVAREPRPDAPDWPGRRVLAAVDAIVWPLLWVLLIQHAPEPVGLMGPFVTAMAVLLGLGRLHRAIWVNHRYWFTTWRWGKVMAAMLLIGAVLKVTMTA